METIVLFRPDAKLLVVKLQYPFGMAVNACHIAPDRTYSGLVAVPDKMQFLAFRDDCTMEIWDAVTLTMVLERKHHDFQVLAVAFDSERRRMLWKTSRMFYLEMWSTESWQCIDAILHTHSIVNQIGFCNGEAMAVVAELGGGGAFLRRNIDKPSCVDMVAKINAPVDLSLPCQFSCDGYYLTVFSWDSIAIINCNNKNVKIYLS